MISINNIISSKRICKNSDCSFYFYGPGVERISYEIKDNNKNLNVEILTSDIMQKKDEGKDILKKFEEEKINVIVGTQILA